MAESLYDVLGVSNTASEDQIKDAYKKMSLKYHPDRNRSEDAKEKFQKIAHAKDILLDEKKRAIYDKYGEEGLNGGGIDPMDMFFGKDAGVFENMFGFGTKNKRKQPSYTKMKVNITLEKFLKGGTFDLKFQRKVKCDSCEATGHKDKMPHKCTTCNGEGIAIKTLRRGNMIQQFQELCDDCSGTGNDKKNDNLKCGDCDGNGSLVKEQELSVKIPKTYPPKPQIFPKKGTWETDCYTDLAIIFNVKITDPNYTINGEGKLCYNMEINLSDVICGFSKLLEHPSGNSINIVSKEGYVINPNMQYILRNLGFPKGETTFDDMILSFTVKYPSRINLDTSKKLTFSNLSNALGSQKGFNYVGISDRVIHLEEVSSVDPEEYNYDQDSGAKEETTSCAQQ